MRYLLSLAFLIFPLSAYAAVGFTTTSTPTLIAPNAQTSVVGNLNFIALADGTISANETLVIHYGGALISELPTIDILFNGVSTWTGFAAYGPAGGVTVGSVTIVVNPTDIQIWTSAPWIIAAGDLISIKGVRCNVVPVTGGITLPASPLSATITAMLGSITATNPRPVIGVYADPISLSLIDQAAITTGGVVLDPTAEISVMEAGIFFNAFETWSNGTSVNDATQLLIQVSNIPAGVLLVGANVNAGASSATAVVNSISPGNLVRVDILAQNPSVIDTIRVILTFDATGWNIPIQTATANVTLGPAGTPATGYGWPFNTNPGDNIGGNLYLNNPEPAVSTFQGAQTNNPIPSISSLDPSSTSAGGPSFTLTVNGADFVNGSILRWNGSNRTTTYVSATQLKAAITAFDIATAGTALVTVFNPSPGGGESNPLQFVTAAGTEVSTVLAFAQIAVGGGYTTTLTFPNTGAETFVGNLILTDPNGNPLVVNFNHPAMSPQAGPSQSSIVDSIFPLSIPPGGVANLSLSPLNPEDDVQVGWARVESLRGSLEGVATYRLIEGTELKEILGVLASQPTPYATIPMDNDDSQDRFTGFAVANPSDDDIYIKLVTVREDGTVMDIITPTELNPLGPQQQVARFLTDAGYLPSRATFTGLMVLVAQGSKRFVAVALVLNEGQYTAIPVIPEKAPNVPN